jgi:hypothetical protein
METAHFDPSGIIAGDHPLTHQPVVVLSGEGVLPRGTVLGQIALGAAGVAAKAGGNTGNGTFALDGSTPIKPGAKAGVYTLRILTAAANGGVARLMDPDGFSLGDYAITGGAGGAVTIDNDIKGVLSDGATDFVVGDGFDITVAAGSGKWRKATAAAVDGSATPRRILADQVDATSADVTGPAYLEGVFAQENLTYGTGHNAATVEAAFRAANAPIYLKSVGAVA